MVRRPQPPWSVYKQEMDFLCYGDALWEPSPANASVPIRIGDVGFIRRGQFHLLFSAGSPLGSRRRGRDVPTTFKPLNIGEPRPRPSLPPGCLRTTTVLRASAELAAAVPSPYVQPLPAPATLECAPSGHREHGTSFSFELTNECGAALVTKYKTIRVDAVVDSGFEAYTKEHYKSWVIFAREKQLGNNVHPVLVSGVDMTRDFTMVTYSDNKASFGGGEAVNVQAFASASASLPGIWYARCTPHRTHGPEERTSEPNQCVFIRYYTMRSRTLFGLLPKVIRAGAGPHDLGSGDNTGETSPELLVDYGATSDEEDFEGEWYPTADCSDSDQEIVVRNTPNDEEYSNWDTIADYVFQNSDAVSVLMHHRELVGIRMVGHTDDLRTLLDKHKPGIVMDASGVGRITFPGVLQPNELEKRPETSVQTWVPGPSTQQPSALVAVGIAPSIPDTRRRLDGLEPSSDEYRRSLRELFHHQDLESYIQELQEGDLLGFIELLDSALDYIPTTDDLFQTTLRTLQGICSNREVLPSSHFIQGRMILGGGPSTARGFAYAHNAELNGRKVVIKTLREYSPDGGGITKKAFYREVVIRRRLNHPNIVPFLGIPDRIPPFKIVFDWMENGRITEYVKRYPSVDRIGLLWDVADALHYLHSCEIIHGDLKVANILVDKEGHACLADFGPISIKGEDLMLGPQDPNIASMTTWAAPELLRSRGATTKEGDVFTFAMVAVEIYTGHPPLCANHQFALFDIITGKRPPRPGNLTHDDLWKLLQNCWYQEPEKRPTAVELFEFFQAS